MEVLYERCAGLDVHKKTVVACVITPEGQETRTFATTTRDLLKLADWFADNNVTHVAMESTGVYWKSVHNLLEDHFTSIVANAYHIKAVPGRKTDVKDAEWIAQLLRHGLIRASFIPDRANRELRELVRYRRSLIQQRAQTVNRIQKVLEGCNIKLGDVASDIVGVSGLAMLRSLASGMDSPEQLASLAKGRLRDKHDQLVEALTGRVGPHQRVMLQSQLRVLETFDREIEYSDQQIEERMRPFEDAIRRLDTIAGVGKRAAQDILAETGSDMSRFPTERHFSSWAKMSPGNYESAGKRKSGWTGGGNRWLRSALVEAAHGAAAHKSSYLSAQYRRLAARRGAKRAAVAVGHSILVIIYHLLKDGGVYRDLGPNYFDESSRERVLRSAVRRIERLGYKVALAAA